jgi:hypothetical protein
MYIRLTHRIYNPSITSPKSLVFPVGKTTVTIRAMEPGDVIGDSTDEWLAIAEVEREPKDEKLLQQMKRHEECMVAHKTITVGEAPDLIAFGDQVWRELDDSILSVLQTLRWRLNTNGGHNPISSTLGLSRSTDRMVWVPVPGTVTMLVGDYSSPDVSPAMQYEIAAMISSGDREPLAQNLFREAWHLEDRNPRSSLLLGVAALEVATKSMIVSLLPQTEWLVENMPSPSVETMLREYLPKLPVKNAQSMRIHGLPKVTMELIRKSIQMRNRLAHARPPKIEVETLRDILEMVSDLIWLFDFYCGHRWAADYIKSQTIRQMTK